jgi:hypothetical protein
MRFAHKLHATIVRVWSRRTLRFLFSTIVLASGLHPVLAQAPTPSPTTIKGRETAALSPSGQTRVTLAVGNLSTIEPGLAQDIQSGAVTIVESNQAGLAGTSDFDTIAVDTEGKTPEAIAATLYHEYQHVLNDRAAGTEFDPNTRSDNQPASTCYHASIAADTAWVMCLLSFDNPTMGCDEVDVFVDAAQAYINACLDLGGSCGGCTLPDPEMNCGCHA